MKTVIIHICKHKSAGLCKLTRGLVVLIFFVLGSLGAVAQGPNAPEAAGFEPVDATDMVNLITGDFTYVLPLLNVPSPEGGYPIALSYHAGVGMDQEASWVGLGWNLNPGAINRGVNGYPDDWKNASLTEQFYDVGGSETIHSLSLSYTSLESGLSTISTTFSYSSNKGFGGSVGIGHGFDLGGGNQLGVTTNVGIAPGGYFNASRSVGFQSASGLSMGVNVGTHGVGAGIGFNGGQGANYSGGYLSVSHSFEGETALSLSYSVGEAQKRSSIGISFSSSGISIRGTVEGVGTGINLALANSISANDYNVDVDRTFFALAFPIGGGIASVGYNRQKIKWYLNTTKTSGVSGILYLSDAIKYACRVKTKTTYAGANTTYSTYVRYYDSPSQCDCTYITFSSSDYLTKTVCVEATLMSANPVNGGEYFMDVHELGTVAGKTELKNNNAMFPAHDDYRVAAQGLSGTLTPIIEKAGALMGLPRRISDNPKDYEVKYQLGPNSGYDSGLYFSSPDVGFTFKNEYSSSFLIEPGQFIQANDPSYIHGYYNNEGRKSEHSPRRDGRAVKYYTLRAMYEDRAGLLPKGFLENNPLTENSYLPPYEKIGGYEITTPDGKTYHYKQPVFNDFTRTRTIGIIGGKPERESYFQSNQGSYVTHWLLSAITGPNYSMETGSDRSYPDEGDSGYWVRFDYGKWSGSDIWKAPYGKEYNTSKENPKVKSQTHGRKELYYLDRIKTRTHTAIFVKNTREDDFGTEWNYKSFSSGKPNSGDFDQSSILYHSQVPLRLEKIILVKNNDDTIDKTSGSGLADETYSGMRHTDVDYYKNFPNHNLHTNVIDVTDNIAPTLAKAIKVIDFGSHYSYDLVNGALNAKSGRLTLNGVTFLGKGGAQVLPPYTFEYDNSSIFDFENKTDLWGYHEDDPATWSLNTITTPTGGSIGIDYEKDDYSLVALDPSITPGQGGGLRVKRIRVHDELNSYSTSYLYNKPGTSESPSNPEYISSGVLSYIPLDEDEEPTIGYGSELPAPMPLYEYVTVKSGQSNNTEDYVSKTTYKFKVLDAKDPNKIKFGDLLEITDEEDFYDYNHPNSNHVRVRNIAIKNNLACLGQLLEVSQFNNKGHLMSKMTNTYARADEISKGILQEGYEVFKEVDYEKTSQDDWLINSSKRTSYPSVLKQTDIVRGGHHFTTQFTKHDDVTGMVLETISSDSRGNTLKTEITPAYHIPKYFSMGPKFYGWSYSGSGKNMLSQIAMQKTLLNVDGNWRALSIGITTWKGFYSGGPIKWRKHKTFMWNGELNLDGTLKDFNSATNDDFVWDSEKSQTNPKWVATSEVLQYDRFSLPTMVKDVNGNYSSTRTCDQSSKIMGMSNSKLLDWRADGAEYIVGTYFGGGVTADKQSSIMAHTGNFSVLVRPGQRGFKTTFLGSPGDNTSIFSSTPGRYKVSVWVNSEGASNARINTGEGDVAFNGEIAPAGDWTQLNHYFDFTGSENITVYITSANDALYMDDFRVSPVAATVTTYVYNEKDELTHILGPDNRATHYEYDAMGKLIRVYNEIVDDKGMGGLKKTQEHKYYYKNTSQYDADGEANLGTQ